MASVPIGAVARRLGRIFGSGTVAGLDEGQLLDRFLDRRDESAFEALVARFGPMVMGVCRGLLSDPHDVEDAFQATFLVLVKKGGSIRDRARLGNWLYGVAHRVAAKARVQAATRRALEGAPEHPDVPAPTDLERDRMAALDDLRPALHEEVARLPDRYREPIVLCYLQGQTHEDAARSLGWPVGTVKGRLCRARRLLHDRLVRRGATLAGGAALVALTREAKAAVPDLLIQRTVKAAMSFAAGRAVAAGVVPATAAALADGVIQAMWIAKLKVAVGAVVALGVVLTGAGLAAQGRDDDPEGSPPQAAQKVKAPGGSPEVEYAKSVAGGAPTGFGPSASGFAAGDGSEASSDPRSMAILDTLAQPVSMPFGAETPLEDVLKYIKVATQRPDLPQGIPIYVDPAGLQEAERTMQSPITLEVEGIPLDRSLHLVLRQLDLAYTVKDGLLYISYAKSRTMHDLLLGSPMYEPSELETLEYKVERGELSDEESQRLRKIREELIEQAKFKAELRKIESEGITGGGAGGGGPFQ
jgi:RNA polymerase sigma factor (sigma-70 family)